MKKHELLKKAYDNYPKGTKIYSTSGNGQIGTLNGNYQVNSYGSVEDSSSFLVYNSTEGGIWASIIVSEKPKTEDEPKELEVDNWYKTAEENTLLNYQGKGQSSHILGYGFCSGNWIEIGSESYKTWNSNILWTLATEQEVFEALKNEAVKRNYPNSYIKIMPHITETAGEKSKRRLGDEFELEDDVCLKCVGNGGYTVFHEGKWAEIIEEVKQPEFILLHEDTNIPAKVRNNMVELSLNKFRQNINGNDMFILPYEMVRLTGEELEEIYQTYKSLKYIKS